MIDQEFVELNRTFHEFSQLTDNDDVVHRSLLGVGSLTWTDLISHHRVVLLSEAGSGKSTEIRNIARSLRVDGKPAFFIRLEYVVDGLEGAFEEGTYDELLQWLKGSNEGWILLDSVDEARLHSPSDFERAIRKLGSEIGAAKQRAHLIITSRTTAWRSKTDLGLCMQALPYILPIVDEVENEDDPLSILREPIAHDSKKPMYKVVAFRDLSTDQIETFSRAKGVRNTRALLDEVERTDAWSFTSRPQDLEDLIAFWKEYGRIGSRLELMRNGIQRRLDERDQKRAEARPISTERIRSGVRAVAAACTLSQTQTIRVPDGSANVRGLPIKDILTDWDDMDCGKLLSRPIFDEAIYGTVRFHHRTVREYLTAEWFSNLLQLDTSRRRIEELFFREQYGLEVVVPSLRPILPWLALMDSRICERIRKVAPELLFEGGDPSRLSLDIRQQVLHQVCDQIAGGASGRSMMDYAAVQRFSGLDISEDIVARLIKHRGHGDLQWFLLRMVWHGQLTGALEEAKKVALEPLTEQHARTAAFRAVATVGSAVDMADVRAAFLAEPPPLARDLLAALLEHSEPTDNTVNWLFDCIDNIAEREPFNVDNLSSETAAFFERAAPELSSLIIHKSSERLKVEPFIEQHDCQASEKFDWLLVPTGLLIQKMIEMRLPGALAPASLGILYNLPRAQEYDRLDFTEEKLNLKTLVPAWSELNLALYWYIAEQQRAEREKQNRLHEWWGVSLWRSYVHIGPEVFDALLTCVQERLHPDDKLLALTLAYKLYVNAGHPAASLCALQTTVEGNPALSERLDTLMRPTPESEIEKEFRESNAEWARDSETRKQERANLEARWREAMRSNPDGLRAPPLNQGGQVSDWQHRLHERMRKFNGKPVNSKKHDWKVLEKEFGPEIACAFRDGVVSYWRRQKPKLRSEGAPADRLEFSNIFGLTGLDIEAREVLNWPSNLDESDAELAFRYAMHELNGFPEWMPHLHANFPELVRRMSLVEISYELSSKHPKVDSFYFLYRASSICDWLWDSIAPDLYNLINTQEPKSISNLQYVLKMLNGSSVSDIDISRLARRKAKSLRKPEHVASWYGTWVGVEPDVAIPALQSRLAKIDDRGERTLFAMRFVVALQGGRRSGTRGVRQAYRTPTHLKALYLIMHEHIKRIEDIDRVGKGVYTPSLRDDAQDARGHLFNLLKEIPGKETYLALAEISRAHPDEDERPWFTLHAKTKAELDADNLAWTPEQVRDFQAKLERTPTNNRDLFDLACMRLTDLKDDLENGDSSIADTLKRVDQETEMRKVIGNWCRERSADRYHVPQEEELADAKRPDLRFLGNGFDSPIPTELKLAENWSGPQLYERLEVQLCGDYLRDRRSSRGVFLLVYGGRKNKKSWQLPGRTKPVDFSGLVDALQNHWRTLAHQFPNVDDIRVIGIDLTKRANRKPVTA
ncbi:ATP-binding protein [Pseudomonas fuscovaginae UPB0736]|uniref:NACHT domain-containing protein n=1 Tax=Pseudomonas asplenii TaxID=53407 RepID=UPI0002887F55|nr:ATP-binding protein [Pseudomonas fuscovaginae]UUQ64407.1 ATP-binding protein [Pseudomonas fuscovaginae UPB0736]